MTFPDFPDQWESGALEEKALREKLYPGAFASLIELTELIYQRWCAVAASVLAVYNGLTKHWLRHAASQSVPRFTTCWSRYTARAV